MRNDETRTKAGWEQRSSEHRAGRDLALESDWMLTVETGGLIKDSVQVSA